MTKSNLVLVIGFLFVIVVTSSKYPQAQVRPQPKSANGNQTSSPDPQDSNIRTDIFKIPLRVATSCDSAALALYTDEVKANDAAAQAFNSSQFGPAECFYRRSIELGSTTAEVYLANLYVRIQNPDLPSALRLLTDSANRSNGLGVRYLALWYEKGVDGPPNLAKMKYWTEKALTFYGGQKAFEDLPENGWQNLQLPPYDRAKWTNPPRCDVGFPDRYHVFVTTQKPLQLAEVFMHFDASKSARCLTEMAAEQGDVKAKAFLATLKKIHYGEQEDGSLASAEDQYNQRIAQEKTPEGIKTLTAERSFERRLQQHNEIQAEIESDKLRLGLGAAAMLFGSGKPICEDNPRECNLHPGQYRSQAEVDSEATQNTGQLGKLTDRVIQNEAAKNDLAQRAGSQPKANVPNLIDQEDEAMVFLKAHSTIPLDKPDLSKFNEPCKKYPPYPNPASDLLDARNAANVGLKFQAFCRTKNASDHGSTEGMVKLADLFWDGEGTSRDPELALRLYQQAALEDNLVAQYGLYLAYRRGSGVPQDSLMQSFWISQITASDDGKMWLQRFLAMNPRSE